MIRCCGDKTSKLRTLEVPAAFKTVGLRKAVRIQMGENVFSSLRHRVAIFGKELFTSNVSLLLELAPQTTAAAGI